MTGAGVHRDSVRLVALAWALVALGAAILVLGYTRIADSVVLYRPPWAAGPTWGTKSFITVGRIALMGVGQVGAATAMVFATRGVASWERFWRSLALVAGVKTVLECVSFVLPHGGVVERAVTLATFAVVVSFLLAAAMWWRRGELRAHPRLVHAPLTWLIASMALWLAFALAPRFLE